MELASPLLAAQLAVNQQTVAISMIKKAAEMDAAIVEMVAESVSTSSRGQSVNITA